MLSVNTKDDAGKLVPLVRCNLIGLPLWTGPLPREVQRCMRTLFESDARRKGWGVLFRREAGFRRESGTFRMLGIAMIPGIVIGFPTVIMPRLGVRMPISGFGSVWIILCVLLPATIWIMWRLLPWGASDRQRRLVARVAAEQGYCGSCGYRLAGSHKADGCCLCPECGAAWNCGSADVFE
ncbi:hypothetical protein PHYC_01133 [Phycisphaerales bacterium]|nr:hypothetical protein PHYC_01133 [Phycisphaerales bacterium]